MKPETITAIERFTDDQLVHCDIPCSDVLFDSGKGGSNNSEYTYSIVLIVPRMFRNMNKAQELERLQQIRSATFENGPAWGHVEAAEWLPLGRDAEIASKIEIAWLASVTEQEYGQFARLVLPINGIYEGFSGDEIPPLDWIKLQYPDRAAVALYCRKRCPSFTRLSPIV